MRLRRPTGPLGLLGLAAGLAGLAMVIFVLFSQVHAPQPTRRAAGRLFPARQSRVVSASRDAGRAPTGPLLSRSRPVSITIPAIGVHSVVNAIGLNPNGTLQVPPLNGSAATNEAAWYRYSPTPGALGPSVILGHIDSAAAGPSVFFRLGALRPGNRVDVGLKDGTEAVFRVDGVRQYQKARFPTATVYGNTGFAALRLISCSGAFDYASHHYLSNVVVFASLVSSSRIAQAP